MMNEEENKTRESKRKIRERLIDFRVYLKKQNYASNTSITTLSPTKGCFNSFLNLPLGLET